MISAALKFTDNKKSFHVNILIKLILLTLN